MDALEYLRNGLLSAVSRDAPEAICKLCGAPTADFDLVDFNKCCSLDDCYPFGISGLGIKYVRCSGCEFIFTAGFDKWTPTDYAEHIYNAEYIKVDGEYSSIRPRKNAAYVARRFTEDRGIRILDYGSGASVFEAEMRNAGFPNVMSFDPYSSPARPTGLFDVITSFEVLEHCADPISALTEIGEYLKPEGIAVIQTGLQPDDIDAVRGRWWYIAPRNGHISIFGLKSLAAAAKRAKLSVTVASRLESNDVILCKSRNTNRRLLAAMLGNQSESYYHVSLTAPGGTQSRSPEARCMSPTAWHAIETRPDGLKFRWSSERTLRWDVEGATPAWVDIDVPVVMEIKPGFTAGASIVVNGREIPTKSINGRISGTAHVPHTSGIINVELRTTEPLVPAVLGHNSDRRPLGLAIKVGI